MPELYRIIPPLIYDSYAAYSYIPPFEPHEYLAQITTQKEAEILERIAQCESKWVMKWNYLHNVRPDYYTAFGYFQIIKTHELKYGIDRTDPKGNIDLAVLLYRKNGTSDWLASASCWR